MVDELFFSALIVSRSRTFLLPTRKKLSRAYLNEILIFDSSLLLRDEIWERRERAEMQIEESINFLLFA